MRSLTVISAGAAPDGRRSADERSDFCAFSVRKASSFRARSALPTASMRIANSAALVAPAGPMAKVAVGTPAGICTMDNRLSTPASAFVCTGTPSTGSAVSDATMPGR